ncbi:MAG: hypothetical protein IRZ00_09610 [Gemmatimonadetes bacterium]|nr:hypothetical protein [Gemmatimonadota bacterium]
MKLATSSLLRALACATALALMLPVGAQAQIGGMLKKKLKEKIKGSAPAAAVADEAEAGPHFGGDLLEINADVADRLLVALKREKAYLDSVNAFVAKLPTPEAYKQCEAKVLMSPAVQKLYKDDPTMEELTAIGEKTKAAVEKGCGPNPEMFTSAKSDAAIEAPNQGAAAGRFNEHQYRILKERALPFCVERPKGDGGAKIPGAMPNMYYVYSANEVKALTARCGVLLPLLKSLT